MGRLIAIIISAIIMMVVRIFTTKGKRKLPQVPLMYERKILVDLEKCEIIGGVNFHEGTDSEWPYYVPDFTAPELYSYDSHRNESEVYRIRCFLDGITYVSEPIVMSREGIMVKFMEKKTTEIYLKSFAKDNYFFDVNFLYSE